MKALQRALECQCHLGEQADAVNGHLDDNDDTERCTLSPTTWLLARVQVRKSGVRVTGSFFRCSDVGVCFPSAVSPMPLFCATARKILRPSACQVVRCTVHAGHADATCAFVAAALADASTAHDALLSADLLAYRAAAEASDGRTAAALATYQEAVMR